MCGASVVSHRLEEDEGMSLSRFAMICPAVPVLSLLFAQSAWGGKTYISHCGIEDRHWDRPGL